MKSVATDNSSLLGVIVDEVPTLLRHLLNQKGDRLHVCFDSLQRPGLFDKRKDVAHRAW